MMNKLQTLMLMLFVRVQTRPRDERGEAVPWLIVLIVGIGIAYFAGHAVWNFVKSLVPKLGSQG